MRVAELRERVAPPDLGLGRAETAVDDGPALGILERVAVDVIERPGQGKGDAVDALADRRDLDRQGARRSNSTNAACVTGMCSEKICSTASAKSRISSCAVEAFRRLRKFINERALSVQWNCV